MYGNHVLKSGLGRITENTPAYTGVVIYSMSDIPLGFGVTAKSTADCRKMDPSGIVVFHQADVGKQCCGLANCIYITCMHLLCCSGYAGLSECAVAGEYLRNEDEL